MKVGDHVAWTSQDDEGKLSHRGMVVTIKTGWVKILTPFGLIGIPDGDGTIKQSTPVKGIKGAIKKHNALPKKIKESKVAVSAPAGATGSRFDQMMEMFAEAKDTGLVPNRAETIQRAVNTYDMTPAGASTYYAKVKKELKLV